jgi:hypothetical protein
MIERRLIIRKRVKIPMRISFFEEEEKDTPLIQLEGDIRDITINGIGLEVKVRSHKIWEKLKDFDPKVEKDFYLHLEILSSEKKIAAYGTAAWCLVTDSEKKELRIGIFLNQMDANSSEEWYRFVEKL